MVEDRYLYDPVAGRYTVERYLDDLESRYGGIDSVLIWYIYPNIGVDDRNQFDFAHDLPGGLDGLRGAVADFHQRGVKVFLPTMPWDNGTRPHSEPDWELMAELVAGGRRGRHQRRHVQRRAARILRCLREARACRSCCSPSRPRRPAITFSTGTCRAGARRSRRT